MPGPGLDAWGTPVNRKVRQPSSQPYLAVGDSKQRTDHLGHSVAGPRRQVSWEKEKSGWAGLRVQLGEANQAVTESVFTR